ncbi:Ig-like domain-containing protein [Agaribacterium haliotis]|uniref:Ig-like domain-containing protein n=1 Tax=Agaribacterium haliotis TaxID=2013869 RepID=UPI000BB55117|nr:Ig-like domain-containing protein [Agaribacterium haliotis]
MFKKHPKALLSSVIGAVVAGGVGLATSASAAVQVDINANVKHSVNGANQFERERRITMHASPIENEFIGEKEKLDYLMELGVHFGRDAGTSMWYFKQTEGDPTRPPAADDVFPYGFLDEHSSESLKTQVDGYYYNLENKYVDSQEYFDRTKYMIGATQPHPAFPNWSTYSWFGGGLDTENPWRPRTNEQTGKWVAEFLEEAYLREDETGPKLPMPHYWEVVNEPDMQMNTTGPEGHVNTWEALFEYHNVMADEIRARLGNKAPKVGGMTWGLHDFHLGDATAFGAPRLQNEALLTAFYGADTADNQVLKDRIRGEFAASPTMSDSDTGRSWYQWDVIWKQFLDTAGENMDFYSIHLYDWPLWQTQGGKVRTGAHSEAVMDLLEWYDDKMVPGPKKEVIVSEFGSVTGSYQENGTTIDRSRMRWEKLKPFSQMQMQFLERPDYITMSLPFVVVKGAWGDLGKEQPYSQSILDRDYSTCESTADAYTNCTWEFNESIHWYELWRDVDGTRLDTYSSDRDIQVDAYVNNNDKNGENHLYVIVNSMETSDTEVDLSWAGIDGNAIQSIQMRHLYLDEAIDSDNNPGNGVGQPIMAEASLASLPESLVVGADATIILDIEYASAINPAFNNNETKFSAEPLSSADPYRVDANGSTITAQVNGVSKPAKGEAQIRITGAFFLSHYSDSGVERSSLTINGNEVALDNDLRGEGQDGLILATLEYPFPVEYLAADGNNVVEFSFLPAGQLASMAIQVWDHDTDIVRSTEATETVAVEGFSVAENSVSVKVTQSQALTSSFSPANASNKVASWTSSNPSVASVDPNGMVTGTGVGTATITAVSVDGSISDTVSVNVTALTPDSVGIVGVPSTLFVGSSKQLSAAVRPIHAPNRSVEWKSSNPAVISVSASGEVTAEAAGTATITATTSNGIAATASISAEILMPETLSLEPETTLMPNGDSLPVQVSISPSNASLQNVKYSSSNPGVADVVGGDIVALSEGTATITGTIDGTNLSDTITVEVVDPQGAMVWREAETFDATGGSAGGFELNEAAGNINYNQTGDWADFVWNFEHAGIYQFAISYGTEMTNAGIEVSINEVANARAGLPATGGWDMHVETVVSNAINVPSAGTHTVRIKSVGVAEAWQWNADKIGLQLLKASACAPNCPTPAPSPSVAPSTAPSPSPSPVVSPSPSPSPVVSPSPAPSVAPSPSPSPVVSPSPVPSPSLPPVGGDDDVVVEIEDFDSTGRDSAAIGGDSINGFNVNGSTINWNTTGDYAEYTVSFAKSGTYNIVLDVASPMTGELGVAVSLNGTQIAASGLSATGDWEAYESQVVATNVVISAGTYTLRVQSQGASDWQWNADKLTFSLVSSTEPSPEPSLEPSPVPSVEPSPETSPAPDAGEPILTEAENWVATGGTQDGFTTRTFWGTTTFADHVLTGGWADYEVTFPASGNYDLSFIASSMESSDSNAKIYIDGVEVAEAPVHGDNLNVFKEHAIASGLNISAGTHTIRIEATGSTLKWHFFLDSFTFTAK